MIDAELQTRIDGLEAKVDAIYKSVEKTRRYFLIITWITIIAVVLPLVGLVFAVPAFLDNYVGTLNSLGM